MATAKELHEFAVKCTKQAATTHDRRIRDVLIETSRRATEAAQRVEWAGEEPEQPSMH